MSEASGQKAMSIYAERALRDGCAVRTRLLHVRCAVVLSSLGLFLSARFLVALGSV